MEGQYYVNTVVNNLVFSTINEEELGFLLLMSEVEPLGPIMGGM